MDVVEMRMLEQTSGVTKEDKLKNEYTRGSIRVNSIVDKMRWNRFKQLGNVLRKEQTDALRVVKGNIQKKGKDEDQKIIVGGGDFIENYMQCN